MGLALPSATRRGSAADAGLDMRADERQSTPSMRCGVSAASLTPRRSTMVRTPSRPIAARSVAGQVAEMGGAEDRAAAHDLPLRGAVTAEVAEIGAAFERHDMGERGIEHGRALACPALPNHVGSGSEFLRQAHQEGPALAELGGADADAQAIADLVAVVEQVDDVEAQLRALAEPDRDLLHQRQH